MTEAFLGLGANLGDRAATLDRAAADLAELGAVRRSHWYETEAVGIGDAPSFLNGAVGLKTDADPRQLFERTRAIELRLGRDPGRRQGSRTIDIDLLLFGDRIAGS